MISERGFSLVEVVIAIVILSFAMIPLLGLLVKSIQTNRDVPRHLVAVLLADEALSVVKNLRDTNIFTGDPAFTNVFTTGVCTVASPCIIGYNPTCFDPACTTMNDSKVVDLCDDSPQILSQTSEEQKIVKYVPSILMQTSGEPNNLGYVQTGPPDNRCEDYDTEYKRTVVITQIVEDKRIEVEAVVSWDNGEHTFTLNQDLYAWKTP
jgi:prepilin-type N-terminal cleavage/methylation domain-containing protein